MCNYLALLPVCPTCIRIRRDGSPTDPLLIDPTPVAICMKALNSQQICHFNDFTKPHIPQVQQILGSEQCSMCEQADAQQYLPSISSQVMEASGLAEELDELKTSGWPNLDQSFQVAGSQGHLLRVLFTRQLRKRQLLARHGAPSLIKGAERLLSEDLPEDEMPRFLIVEFSGTLQERKEEQRAYFESLYSVSAYTDRLPSQLATCNVTLQDAAFQIGRWVDAEDFPGQVEQPALNIFRDVFWNKTRQLTPNGVISLAACVGLALVREGWSPSVKQLASMARLHNTDQKEDVDQLRHAYETLIREWRTSKGKGPSALKNSTSRPSLRTRRQIRFRSLEEDRKVTVPLESFERMRTMPDMATEEIPSPKATKEFLIQCTMPSETAIDLALQDELGLYEHEASVGISQAVPRHCSWISELTQLPAVMMIDTRGWRSRESSLRLAFAKRWKHRRAYDKLTKPKFPEVRWYVSDALRSASYLLEERAVCVESRCLGVVPPLRVLYATQLLHREDGALAGHIRLAVDLQTRMKKGRTDVDVVQYMAHLLAISYEIGRYALKELIESPEANNIVPNEKEWKAAGEEFNRKRTEANERTRPWAQTDKARNKGTLSPDIRLKVAKFYRHWVNRWLGIAQQLQQHEPVRDIIKDSRPVPIFNSRKRSHEELVESFVTTKRTPKRLKGGSDTDKNSEERWQPNCATS